MKIKSIIIDDEPLARELLEGYIKEIPSLELLAVCKDALEAGAFIRENEVDVMFLDIRMPKLSGIHFMKSLSDPPLVVFTTAYPEHAVEGFELEAVDYLVKPIAFERFLKAVNRVADILRSRMQEAGPMQDALVVKADKKIMRINQEDIRYIQSVGDYLKIVLEERSILVHDTLKNIEGQLLPGQFIRIHKSYIVPLARISYLEGNQVKIGEEMLPVGAAFKGGLIERLRG